MAQVTALNHLQVRDHLVAHLLVDFDVIVQLTKKSRLGKDLAQPLARYGYARVGSFI